ncbi:MAG TPA: 2-oxoglutarate dehydrogenase complex dihydrolipoyllysine-residue succinyltransferase [Steroidobacteraceae bacterium]|nr:2-oxoglutarate dehydrogenase complex dihydrolipoyllysine-residue succinyltransferase [Steroidobacteraceae bacterium]
MNVEIRVPQLPESVADATLVAWRKQPGEAVGRDENLADLETDKVVLEVPSPVAGVLQDIRVQAGATVRSGELLAVISAAASAGASASAAAAPAPAVAVVAAPVAAVATAAAPKLGPAAQRVADELRLGDTVIASAARGGRVSKSDLVAAVGALSVPAAPAGPVLKAVPAPSQGTAPAAKPTALAPAPASTAAAPGGARADRRVPMTRLRQRIAERLVQAQSTQALLTTFNEIDLTNINELRARYKDSFEKQHGVKLGFMSFFVKAAIEGLRRYPLINAAVSGTDIVYHDYYDIGVAVSTERGLMVPVLRDADALDFAGIERGIATYAQRAREGTIALEDLSGGTFSITNGGVFGSLLSTPIVNAPQSAILGMHKTMQRAVVVDGQVVARPMMYLALSYDHRIIDGKEAVQFLVTVKDCLEDPGRMLLGV